MANPGDFAYTVKQQADIVRIIGDYVKLKKAGAQNYSGLCPFHGEKTPSFSVHATRQFYHCFGCGVSGDVFSFIQKIENITFPESVRWSRRSWAFLCPRPSYPSRRSQRSPPARTVPRRSRTRGSRFFRNACAAPKAPAPVNTSQAAASIEEMISSFRIGYAPDSGFLLRDRLKEEFAKKSCARAACFRGRKLRPQQCHPEWSRGPWVGGCPVLVRPHFGRTGRGS